MTGTYAEISVYTNIRQQGAVPSLERFLAGNTDILPKDLKIAQKEITSDYFLPVIPGECQGPIGPKGPRGANYKMLEHEMRFEFTWISRENLTERIQAIIDCFVLTPSGGRVPSYKLWRTYPHHFENEKSTKIKGVYKKEHFDEYAQALRKALPKMTDLEVAQYNQPNPQFYDSNFVEVRDYSTVENLIHVFMRDEESCKISGFLCEITIYAVDFKYENIERLKTLFRSLME